MTADADEQPHPNHPDRPAAGAACGFRWRKWDGGAHWVNDEIYLGSDRWGDWLGQPAGWRNTRPGRAFAAERDSVTLVPPSGDFAYAQRHPHPLACTSTSHGMCDGMPAFRPGSTWTSTSSVASRRNRTSTARACCAARATSTSRARDEWDEHRVAYDYPPHLVERLESVAVELEGRVRSAEAPFDDATAAHWLARLAALPPAAPPAAVTFPANRAGDGRADSTATDPERTRRRDGRPRRRLRRPDGAA